MDVVNDPEDRLYIHSPSHLDREDGYAFLPALFGPQLVTQTTPLNVLMVYDVESPTLCNQDQQEEVIDISTRPFIMIVDRGECTFVTKTRNAQRRGAVAVIIANNICLCEDTLCIEETFPTQEDNVICEIRDPILADDGSGSDIRIPTAILSRLDSELLKESIMQEGGSTASLEVTISWERESSIPPPGNGESRIVAYDLYFTPLDEVATEFLRAWKPIACAFGSEARFTPRLYIFDGLTAGCQSDDGESQCYNLCTNNGRYCMTDPDDNLDFGVSGADIVAESLKRICIWKEYGQDDGIGGRWFDNVVDFEDSCGIGIRAGVFGNDDADSFTDKNLCRHLANIRTCVDPTSIRRCIKASGNLQGNVQNSLLEETLENQRTVQGLLNIWPSVIVNNGAAVVEFVSGDTMGNVRRVFEAICLSYPRDAIPRVCLQCVQCDNISDCVSVGVCNRRQLAANQEEKEPIEGVEKKKRQKQKKRTLFTSSRNAQLVVGGMPGGLPVNDYDNPLVAGGAANEILFELGDEYAGVEACDVDLGEVATHLGTALAKYENGGVQALNSPSVILPKTCSGTDKESFLAALDDFQKCSKWDMRELIETIPSALVGTVLRCANLIPDETMMPSAKLSAMEEEDMAQCTDAILGDNPVGRALKSMYLTPDKTCPCFEALTDLPECTLDVWPIPIVGSWLKTASCLTKTFACGAVVESYCETEIAVLDTCLPTGSMNDMQCDSVSQCNSVGESISLSLPEPLLGVPLPDACQRLYKENPKGDGTTVDASVFTRYEAYVQTCTNNNNIWEIQEGPFHLIDNGASVPPSVTSQEFFAGIFIGFGLASVLAFVLRKNRDRDEQKSDSQRYYSAVELVESSSQVTRVS